jgi:hypothetical protein
MSRHLSPRQVIARSYPTWDYAMADRLIAWLDDCGYQIVVKAAAIDAAPANDQTASPLVHVS